MTAPEPPCRGGACDRLAQIERDVEGLVRGCIELGKTVSTIETIISERDKFMTRIWSAMIGVIGISLVHFCVFLVWVGGTNERLSMLKDSDAKQEQIIFRLDHPNAKP